ncbi:MAG: hypothetical protein NVSMB1_14790 [Polyangiales bacterium]
MSDALHEAVARGNDLLTQGEPEEAIPLLLNAAAEVEADARDYDLVIDSLRRAFEITDRPRSLATLLWYDFYARPKTVERPLPKGTPMVDVARTHRLFGDEAAAARSFEVAGLIAHAAVARERANDLSGARALWSRLSHQLSQESSHSLSQPLSQSGHRSFVPPIDSSNDRSASEVEVRSHTPEGIAEQLYVLGLVRYNIARTSSASRGDHSRREAIVAAVSALEESAGRFEEVGQRERAFDCYNALSAIGDTTNTFEHTLEGRVNAIRILREDHLQQYALQQYDETIAIAEQSHEFSAAAIFAREAQAYARTLGLDFDARAFALRAIDLHVATARTITREGGSPSLAENALVSAIGLAADLGLLAKARNLYAEAANLRSLEAARRARHAKAGARLEGAEDTPWKGETKSVARPKGPPLAVWIVDVLEWEQAGRAEEAAAEILFDAPFDHARPRDLTHAPLRRRALVARLVALEVALSSTLGANSADTVVTTLALVRRLADIIDYRVLSPLERLALHPAAAVRMGAVEAAGTMPFKRSAQLLRRAAHDAEPSVVSAVVRSLSRKQSPVFVDPLRRLARDAPTVEVRAAALRALVTIDNPEAVDAILTALEAGSAPERQAVLDALQRRRPDRNGRLALAARERLSKGVTPEVARDLEAALGSGR